MFLPLIFMVMAAFNEPSGVFINDPETETERQKMRRMRNNER